MSRLLQYITEPWRIVVAFDQHIWSIVPDKLYLKCLYHCIVGEKLNLETPQTYTEKLQWLKLYDRNPNYCKLTDKYTVRKEVAEMIGEKYLVPLIGKYNSFDEIDFDTLPNRFVLKCTHDSGSSVICKDKSSFDIMAAREKLTQALKQEFWRKGRESAYNSDGKIKPCIICEQYLYDNNSISDYPDFKFFCFDGKVKIFQSNIGRGTPEGTRVNFFDRSGNPCDIQEQGYKTADNVILPEQLDSMISIAERLSAGIPHVRIDLMLYNGRIYFSEYTFYHCGGFFPFVPNKWNKIMGDYLHLPDGRRAQ